LTKKFFLYVLWLPCLMITPGFSSPLVIGNDGFGNPFLIINNPAMINRQKGVPIGFSFYYNTSLQKYLILTGFSESFDKSAFSINYLKDTQEEYNRFSTAFSTACKMISFGASFHFLFFDEEPDFTLDAGITYHFKERRYIGLVMKNILEIDNGNELLARELCLTGGGNIPKVDRLFFTAKARGILFDFKEKDYGYGGDINVHKFIFNNPSLSIYLKGTVLYAHDKNLTWNMESLLGYHHRFNRFSLGIYAGYKHYSLSEMNSVVFSIYYNPLFKRKIGDLDCSLELNSSKMTPNGDNIHDNVVITIRGSFQKDEVRIKRWTILITDEKDRKGAVIKTFSGGNVPPTSIVWEGRNNEGNLVKNGTYYIKLILVDSINRVISSSYKVVTVF